MQHLIRENVSNENIQFKDLCVLTDKKIIKCGQNIEGQVQQPGLGLTPPDFGALTTGRGLKFAIFFFTICVTSCASNVEKMGSEPVIRGNPNIDAAAWSVDYFTFAKPMEKRPALTTDFFFKHCDVDSSRHTFYSKTSYWCNEPF